MENNGGKSSVLTPNVDESCYYRIDITWELQKKDESLEQKVFWAMNDTASELNSKPTFNWAEYANAKGDHILLSHISSCTNDSRQDAVEFVKKFEHRVVVENLPIVKISHPKVVSESTFNDLYKN